MINNDAERVVLEAMLYAMEGKSPSLAIENQEMREQQKVVRNCRIPRKVNGGIPKECRDKGLPSWGTPKYIQMDWKERNAIVENNKIEWTKQQYEKMGIKILGEADDLFYSVELPDGWEIKPTSHHMWNDVVDDKSRERISFFYKVLSMIEMRSVISSTDTAMRSSPLIFTRPTHLMRNGSPSLGAYI